MVYTVKNIYDLSEFWIRRQFKPYIMTGGVGKWKTLVHNGVYFPPEYVPHRTPVVYDGEKIVLEPEQEEAATMYAKYTDTPYVDNPIFKKNFWKDWKKILGNDHKIQSLDNTDFSLIHAYLVEQKSKKKEDKKVDVEMYKTAVVNGIEQPVGNFRIEPPGIFMGRGCNPNLGKIKKRVYPEDVTINIGKGEKIPVGMEGHSWGEVVHDPEVEWLASWKDTVTGKTKYVWLGSQSDMKIQNDINKFEKARKLKKKKGQIISQNDINLKDDDITVKQTATALYFIDQFALRVGNEKGDDEADTVGVTLLRVEHIKLLDNGKVVLNFLGKDSVRFHKTLEVDEQVYKNLQQFTTNKDKKEQLFDKISSSDINRYLQRFMDGLTSKVFRTYKASNIFDKELVAISKKFSDYNADDKINILLDQFNKANAKVAMLCNHQKNITKSSNKQIENIDSMISKKRKQLKKSRNKSKIRDKIKQLKDKKKLKIQLKNISLGTSKVNYIDPRITVAFMKRHNIPIDKLFSKVLQEKFKWALDVNENFRF